MDGILNGYTSSVDLLKMVTEAYENDIAVFNSAISADYVELFTESIILKEDAEEESKEAAKDKQKENKKITLSGMKETAIKILNKFLEKINSVIDSILDKIDQLFGNVAKKVEAKKDAFMKADCSSMEPFKIIMLGDNIFCSELKNITDEKIKEITSKEKVDIDKEIEAIINSEDSEVEFDLKKGDNEKTELINILTDRKFRDSFVDEKKAVKEWASKEISKVKADKKDDKDNTEFYNAKIKVINAIQRVVCRMINKKIAVWRKGYFDAYRVFCKCAKAKDNTAKDADKKEETTANASYMFELEESAFVEALEAI